MLPYGLNHAVVFSFLLVTVSACSPDAGSSRTAGIIGSDDRVEPSEVNSIALRQRSRAAAAMIEWKNLTPLGGQRSGWKLKDVQTLTEYLAKRYEAPVCPNLRFSEQPTAAWCSAFLVAPDLIATAGHCLKGFRCEDFAFVFDYDVDHGGGWEFSSDAVYRCAQPVVVNDDDNGDFALVRLDRPVIDRQALRLRPSGTIEVGTLVVNFSYPTGLPLKVVTQGQVTAFEQSAWFEASVDSFGGSSGSAVLNATTLEAEGILIVGFGEYEVVPQSTPAKSCVIPRQVSEDEATSAWITPVGFLKKYLELSY